MPVPKYLLSCYFLSILFSAGHQNKTSSAREYYLSERKRQIISCPAPVFQRPTDLEEVFINDNRQEAGELRNGVFYLMLEVREGYWYPDSKNGSPVKIKAFAEVGKPLQVPGPLIRVREGTEMRVSIRNSSHSSVTIFGFTSRLYRPGKYKDSILINQGGTKEFSFNAGLAGTYLYTAKDEGDTLTPPEVAAPFLNSQLYGAFIIDSVNEKINREERILMVGMCGISGRKNVVTTKYVINGTSWPNTEHLYYKQGDTVNWRIINASVLAHPMHLHGFPFVVSSLVFASSDSIIPKEQRKEVVTQNLVPLNRMRITWIPKKEGNWLFHCHLLDHTLPSSFSDESGKGDHIQMTTEEHARSGMGGLIIGINVLPRENGKYESLTTQQAERSLTLLVGHQPQNSFYNKEGKGFKMVENGSSVSNAYTIPGPPLILIKNKVVAIKIINNLKEPTSVHWHGLELDSYYDGVAGWSGTRGKLAPLIEPGDSFTVYLNPSRAGSYMYHTHMHNRQLLEGLYGPLIVLNPGQSYDPATDKVFMISQGGAHTIFTGHWITGFSNLQYLINGSNAPEEMKLKKGIRYRFRVMNISAQQNSYFTSAQAGFFISLKIDGIAVKWTSIDKDGMNNGLLNEILVADHQRAAPGTTHDFMFTPERAGKYVFEARMDQKIVAVQRINVSD